MRPIEVQLRAHGHDAGRVDGRMATVVVMLDVRHVDGIRDSRHLVELAKVAREVRIIGDSAQIALEVADVHRIEANERGEEAPVGLRGAVPDEVALLGEPVLERVERGEEIAKRLLVSLKLIELACEYRSRETAPIYFASVASIRCVHRGDSVYLQTQQNAK